MSEQYADLWCESCDQVTEHELHYAGRLLESVRCPVCGTRIGVSGRALIPAYAHDLEQRVVSKPRRLLRRLGDDPQAFLRGLPGAVARQPAKFWREFRSVLRR